MQSIAENHQLEFLDLSWNSIDAECFAALGEDGRIGDCKNKSFCYFKMAFRQADGFHEAALH